MPTQTDAAKPMAPNEKVKVHVHNPDALGPVFEVSEQRWQEALDRHPDIAARVDATFSGSPADLEAGLQRADALFCWDVPREALAQRAPNLRFVHVHGAGVSHLRPFDWLPPDVNLINSRGVHGSRAAEYAMMAILMINNRIPEMMTNQRQARWEQLFNTAIEGKTLLIIGVGNVGGSVSGFAKNFGMHVIGIRRTGEPRENVDEMHKPDALADLIPRADVVLMTAPHTETSHHMLGKAELDLFKPGAGLVNYSRAALVDYDALEAKLRRGEITAVLDVFDPEPLPESSSLWNAPNLIMTPHCSSDDAEAYTPRTLDLLMRNLGNIADGNPLENVVDQTLQY
ncbi:D-2-hydroxyacid dehydrogenase [Hwanghaeella grinnelliae]|uniref:D-2-hydroxyacid dehydrogenase n=1 Tax=Hwanghaeella grinnelliae TaxID=2500179 RepID=A0A437QV84_9PROT|nr:D-2-hydroxyacid dehydrogenase [Hwanghaeella grinnelliae]RVU38434.1 D-2-hydroxyacid dehydrogenase [Hwanghaeella grinnelliae]